MVLFRQKRLYLSEVVVLKKTGCIRAKVFVFKQKIMYSGKMVVSGQMWLFSGNVVEFG